MRNNFGTRLRDLRARHGLTQQELSEAAGLSISAVQKLEQFVLDPNWSTVQRVAKALGVSVTEFLEPDVPDQAAPDPKPKSRRKRG